jgi:hypothetical protein
LLKRYQTSPITRFLIDFILATTTGFLLLEGYSEISRLRCWSGGYRRDSYLGYCQSQQYGDYEHSALAFGLEPEAVRSFQQAQVLILGNSRAQFAFSTPATRNFFEKKEIRFYNAAFSAGDGSGFAGLLFARLSPQPKMLIINADPFFLDYYSRPAAAVLSQANSTRRTAEAKKSFQTWHASVCGIAPFLCGNTFAVFRSRSDGTLTVSPMAAAHYPLTPVHTIAPGLQSDLDKAVKIGQEFVARSKLPQRCVVLTTVPSDTIPTAVGQQIAARLGVEFAGPQVSNLETFDHSHLTQESADQFANALLQAIDDRIEECVRPAAPR